MVLNSQTHKPRNCTENMCSNTSLSSGCDGEDTDPTIYSKKHKRQRVPKRGPGVAELEKILREQEKKNDFFKPKNEGFSSNSYRPHSPTLPVLPSPQFLDPTKLCNGGIMKGGQIGGSNAVVLPEQFLLPPMWNSSCEPTDVEGPKSTSGLQFSTQRFSSELMRRSRFSPPSIMHLPPVSSPVEPPSNQISNSHFHTSFWPEEEKMVGAKRCRPFSTEVPPIPSFHYPIPRFSPQINRIDSPFSCGNRTIINLEPSDQAVHRDVNFKKCANGYGEKNGNFVLFGSPAFPPPQQERSTFNIPLPFQEIEEESQERRSGEIDIKPIYSFLLERGKKKFNLNDEAVETEGDGIDLNLKL